MKGFIIGIILASIIAAGGYLTGIVQFDGEKVKGIFSSGAQKATQVYNDYL